MSRKVKIYCELCGKQYADIYRLTRSLHQDIETEEYLCIDCAGEGFDTWGPNGDG